MELGFAERLSNTIALSGALADSGIPSSDCKGKAQELEREIFGQAESTDEYTKLFERLLERLGPTDARPENDPTFIEDNEIFNTEGPSFGNYIYATFYAEGQQSTIYKAKAQKGALQEKVVALKVTNPSTMIAPHDSEREARILAEIKQDNIVPILDSFWQAGGTFIIVFPFLRQDLDNLLRSGTLTTRQAGMVYDGLFQALAYIHSRGIIHRDVKPSNILLKSKDGPVYLTDFGIVWSPHDKASEPSNWKITDVGTTCYRAPEILFGDKAYTTALDMWAAGCVVAEMVKKDHRSLFDAGPLGSELGLIKSIFSTLGTPNNVTWPSAKNYSDWGKVSFQKFPPKSWNTILPGASDEAVDFVSSTVIIETTHRLTALQASNHALSKKLKQL